MIETWSCGAPDYSMPQEILTELAGQIARHPWFQARARLAVALLEKMNIRPPAHVLDAGCGWGLNLNALEKAGYRVAGLDVSRAALERLDRPHRRLIEADLTRDPPAAAGAFDAVLALDVIEHLDDDRAALARLARLARPGGAVLVSVPARPDLYSEFDRVQGHRRRYAPETLRRAFADTGLRVERILWWGSWLVPLLRRRQRQPAGRPDESPARTYQRYLSLPPWPVPWLLRLVFALDQERTLREKSRTGTSLVALARTENTSRHS